MSNSFDREESRRKFLQYLAASPVVGMAGSAMAAEDDDVLAGPRVTGPSSRAQDPGVWKPYDPAYLIKRPEDALEVFEFEPIAHKNVPGAHFGFMSTGADDEGSLRANRQDYSKFVIRPRRLRDVRKVDTSIDFLGQKWAVPYFLCPIGSQRMYHRDGELAVARASGKQGVMQALSTYASSCSIGQAREARGGLPVVLQLYQQGNFEVTKAIVQRAEKEGSPAVFVTVDSVSARKDMTFERTRRDDSRLCGTCHDVSPRDPKGVRVVPRKRPMFSEVPAELWDAKYTPDTLTWEFFKRLRDVTKMKIYPKGIMSAEDATLCLKYGLDGVYISNHGARAEDTSGSTVSVLPDVVAAVKGKIPVVLDGGARRGMDVVKALAMGATAVGVGRPYLWGLAAFGEPGVAKVLEILTAETVAAMQQVGAASVRDLTPNMIFNPL